MEICHDCGAKIGELHQLGCDCEFCPRCGHQAISCGCAYSKKDRRVPWNGEGVPGQDACIAVGWMTKWDQRTRKWLRCTADDPQARPDLSRLTTQGRWNPTSQKWEPREHV